MFRIVSRKQYNHMNNCCKEVNYRIDREKEHQMRRAGEVVSNLNLISAFVNLKYDYLPERLRIALDHSIINMNSSLSENTSPLRGFAQRIYSDPIVEKYLSFITHQSLGKEKIRCFLLDSELEDIRYIAEMYLSSTNRVVDWIQFVESMQNTYREVNYQ